MGIIDTKIITLSCDECETKETQSLSDKGSTWGGSYWQNQVEFENFGTKWSGGGSIEPELDEALCKKCGVKASSKISYTS